jgi:hypothetical protein
VADSTYLKHYGILRRSGRYPWGSGGNVPERSRGFLDWAKDLKDKGLSEVEIVKALNAYDPPKPPKAGRKPDEEPTTTTLRALTAIARNEAHAADVAHAVRLKSKGMSNVAIGRSMQINESSVRSLLEASTKDKEDILTTVSNKLKQKVDQGHYVQIGTGVENHLGISATRLATAVEILKQKKYAVINIQVDQLGAPGNKTTVKVLAPKGTRYPDVVNNHEKITTVGAYSEDGGRHFTDIDETPVNVSAKRVGIVYGPEGGDKADGVIYLRPGVPDLALGGARYAQVRIAVDGTHYLKGMAMYKEGLPPGVDMEFHTNKLNTGDKLDALKPQKDEANPFGSTVRQKFYVGADGKKHLSPLNIVNEEGDWQKWSKSLSSQVLSKQPVTLAKRQLDFALQNKQEEYDEIMRLTNPVVRRKLLNTFADSAEAASVQLKAAHLPRQGTHVILPITSLKPNEVYAPNYRPGERVVLIRHPHGGTFEIPELVVNNKNREAIKTLSGHGVAHPATDAIGIHPDVAKRLSGADFDGDQVLVIPNNRGDIKTSAALKGLQNFDPQTAYPFYEGMKVISPVAKQQQMGEVSNLITDMTIKGANHDELAAAVRHSMVIIDAEKHKLNYKQSALDNGIANLKEKYQGRGPTGRLAGASTIISRSGNAKVQVDEKKLRSAAEGGPIDPATGRKVYVKTGASYVDPVTGKVIKKKSISKPLLEETDAHALVSEDAMPIEVVYAAHSNSMKDLADRARMSALRTGGIERSESAAKAYAPEVAELTANLNIAQKNRPLERQAQLVAGVTSKARIQANPAIESADRKKIQQQELTRARARLGAKKIPVPIEARHWEAIQAGAISTKRLNDILDNTDLDNVRKLATPRAATVVTPAKLAIIKARLASGYTQADVADSLGIPVTTLNSALHR